MFASLFAQAPAFPKGVTMVETDDARIALDAGEYSLTVDVRSNEEWASGRIAGAIHAPINELANHMGKLSTYKKKQILLYCRTENRSTAVAKYLAELGFENITILGGGITQWANRGYAIVN